MVLRPYEQDSWIDSMMNDHFEKKYSAKVSGKDNVDSEFAANKAVLVASGKALDDFLMTCQECDMELRVRNPRVSAHCREFMRRYMKLFSGRITLELSSIFGAGMRALKIGCPLILQSVALLQRMKKLFDFSFLPASEITAMLENLMGIDALYDAFINACAADMRYWVHAISMVQPRQQGKLLKEIVQEIDSKLVLLRRYANDLQEFAFHKLRRDSIIRIVSELNEFLKQLSFDDYSDEALIDHIAACRVIDKRILEVFLSWDPISDYAMSTLTTAERESVVRPRKVLLDLSDRCRGNAMRASAKCLSKMTHSLHDVVDLLFKETNKGNSWLGGNVCKALLARMGSWMSTITSALPNEYSVLLKAEAYRFLLLLYIQNLIALYRKNKRARLSSEGVAQVSKDLRMIETWIEETGFCAEIYDLKEILKKLRQFVICDESDLMMCFSGSVQDFSCDNPDFAYDLFRLALKLRDDINPNYRRRILGLCTEYITQFNVYRVSQGDEAIEDLDYFAMRMSGGNILAELLPNVGVLHCTGKKWSYEKVSMSEEESVYIGNLVTETRHHIEMKKLMRKSTFAVDEEVITVKSSTFIGDSNEDDVSAITDPSSESFSKTRSQSVLGDSARRPSAEVDKSLRGSVYQLRPLEMTSLKYEHEHSGQKSDIDESVLYNSVPKAQFHRTIELVFHSGFGELHTSLKPESMYLFPFKSTGDGHEIAHSDNNDDNDDDPVDAAIQVTAEEQKRIIGECEKSSYVYMADADDNAGDDVPSGNAQNTQDGNSGPSVEHPADRPVSVNRQSNRFSSRLLIVPADRDGQVEYVARPSVNVEVSAAHAPPVLTPPEPAQEELGARDSANIEHSVTTRSELSIINCGAIEAASDDYDDEPSASVVIDLEVHSPVGADVVDPSADTVVAHEDDAASTTHVVDCDINPDAHIAAECTTEESGQIVDEENVTSATALEAEESTEAAAPYDVAGNANDQVEEGDVEPSAPEPEMPEPSNGDADEGAVSSQTEPECGIVDQPQQLEVVAVDSNVPEAPEEVQQVDEAAATQAGSVQDIPSVETSESNVSPVVNAALAATASQSEQDSAANQPAEVVQSTAPVRPAPPPKPQKSAAALFAPSKPPKPPRKSVISSDPPVAECVPVSVPVAVPCSYTPDLRGGDVTVLDASSVKLILKPQKPSKAGLKGDPSVTPPPSNPFADEEASANPFADDEDTSPGSAAASVNAGEAHSNPFDDEGEEAASSTQPVSTPPVLPPGKPAPRKSILDILSKKK